MLLKDYRLSPRVILKRAALCFSYCENLTNGFCITPGLAPALAVRSLLTGLRIFSAPSRLFLLVGNRFDAAAEWFNWMHTDRGRPVITFLPVAIEDETLHSLLARQRSVLGCTPHLPIIRSALGSGICNMRHLLPGGLDCLLAGLSGDPETAASAGIGRWTAAAYFAPFMSPSAYERLVENMRSGWTRGGYAGLGLLRGRVSHRILNFCYACREQDLHEHGMAGWRRTHQLPGVYACPSHGVALRMSGVSAAASGMVLPCPEKGEAPELERPISLGAAIRIAAASRWLLRNPQPPQTPAVIQTVFRGIMGSRGLLAINGSSVAGLPCAMAAWLGATVSDSNGPLGVFGSSRNSIQRLWGRTGRTGASPFTALLLMDFLQVEPSEFFARCSDPQTTGPRRKVRRPPEIRRWTVTRHRASVRREIAHLPSKGRTEIRKSIPAAYCFLLAHDRDWLESVLPPPKKVRQFRPWKKQDADLLRQARAAVAAVRSEPGRPRRVSFARIVIAMGVRTSMFRRDPRLRRTLAEITSATEDTPALMRRRAEWALAQPRERPTWSWSSFKQLAGFKEATAGPEVTAWAKEMLGRTERRPVTT